MKPVLALCVVLLAGCDSASYVEDRVYGDEADVPVVYAKAETQPVTTGGDAADDPAIWYNAGNPAASLILGTDKNFGVGVYTLTGELKQNLASGEPNNIDLRQGVGIGNFHGDLAAASNRVGDVVSLYAVDADGIRAVGEFKSVLDEPYGSCMAVMDGKVVVFITYKTGEVQAHLLTELAEGRVEQSLLATIPLTSQLEGCVHDDATGVLYIGEEARGVWTTQLTLAGDTLTFTPPALLDEVGGSSGIAADIEGLAMYVDGTGGYLIASSQGNDSYAVYDRTPPHAFRGRFRVRLDAAAGIDGAQETDGLEVSSRSFGPAYPQGLLVVQDGYPDPVSEMQNFKLVDWRDVVTALGL